MSTGPESSSIPRSEARADPAKLQKDAALHDLAARSANVQDPPQYSGILKDFIQFYVLLYNCYLNVHNIKWF